MKGQEKMHSDKHLNGAIFTYILLLIVVVILNMLKEISMLDIVYLATLMFIFLRFILIVRENRK